MPNNNRVIHVSGGGRHAIHVGYRGAPLAVMASGPGEDAMSTAHEYGRIHNCTVETATSDDPYRWEPSTIAPWDGWSPEGKDPEFSDDHTPTNGTQAEWARVAVEAFVIHTGAAGDLLAAYADTLPAATRTGCAMGVLSDLVCNLFHLGASLGIDPDELVAEGRRHFDAEHQGA